MDWLEKLKEYAPSIATAIVTGGATLPQLAVKAIADATGTHIENEIGLASFVDNASAEDLLKIKQADNSFKARMRELDVELEQSELKDAQHARESHKHSIMPSLVTGSLTLLVAGLFYAMFETGIPDNNKDVFYMLTGQASALWAASITYWVGTTRTSATKTMMMKNK